MQLPMWGFKDEVLSAIEQNQVVIICGETGW
jgi:ATP-dependent RNA helicase DHX29